MMGGQLVDRYDTICMEDKLKVLNYSACGVHNHELSVDYNICPGVVPVITRHLLPYCKYIGID